MSNVVSAVLDLLFVPRCAYCHVRLTSSNIGLCDACLDKYKDEKAKYCDFCGMEAQICACQPHAMLIGGCSDYRKLAFYPKGNRKNVIRSMVYSIKRRYNRPLSKFIAGEIASVDKEREYEDVIVTFCPRSKSNLKKYGYDHAKLLAEFYAEHLGLAFKPLLKRNPHHKTTEQKMLNFNQRAANMHGAFFVKNYDDVKGKTIILIDDVVTSGATVSECMTLLYSAGAKDVICRSFAHTYRKNKLKKD